MKKTLCIVIPIVVVLLVLVGGLFYYIGNKNASEQAMSGKDKEFLSVLSNGLEERSAFVKEQEKVSANGGTPNFTGADYSRELVNKESKIFEFENAEFDSPRLSQLVKEYIDALKKQKEAVDYYSTDYIKYNDIWSKGYAERSTVIAALCDEFGLKLGKDLAEEFKSNARAVSAEKDKTKQIEDMITNIQFTKEKTEYSTSTYSATVENTTPYTFSSMSLTINLYKDDVIVETLYDSTANWESGEKVRFEFMTSKTFDKYKVKGEWYTD